jgi:hypothetical protein
MAIVDERFDTIIRVKRGTRARWLMANPVLEKGEPGHEIDTARLKIGNGISRWTELPYISPVELENGGPVSFEDMNAAIENHVNDEEPHPSYDDGTSLLLRYENAKV